MYFARQDPEPPPESPKPRPSPPAAGLALVFFAVAAAGLFLTRSYISVREDWLPLWQLLQEMVFFGLPWAVFYQIKPESRPFTRLDRPPKLGACVMTALAALIGLEYFSGLDSLWVAMLSRFGLNLDTLSVWLSSGVDTSLFAAMLVTAAAPALFEELSFRGLLLPALERYGTSRAVVLTGTLFALTHMSLPGLPTHLLLGCVLAMLAIASDSLILPMVYHFAHNAGAVALNYMTTTVETSLTDLLSRELTTTLAIQTAVSFVIWALMLRAAFVRASVDGSTVKGEVFPPTEKLTQRIPRGIWISLALMILLLASVYVLQFLALSL
ncbi:hypothetical protein AGMMS49992_03420 [Clostridia bacterium]|nr:hypothetical protein AGMMS49992_03420 [Clostridia bacterium]